MKLLSVFRIPTAPRTFPAFFGSCVFVICVLPLSLQPSAMAAGLNEYTLVLPPDVPANHTLCQANIVIQDTGIYAANMAHNDSEPLADGGALQSARPDMTYRAWVTTREGARTLVVQTTASNVFNVEAGFCKGPLDPAAAVGSFHPVNAPLEGGSSREEDLRGVYDGAAEVAIDLCEVGDGFDTLGRIEKILSDALLVEPGASHVLDSFETGDDGRAHYRFRIIDHQDSLRTFVDAIEPQLSEISEFSYDVGNRVLNVSGCDRKGLWVTIEANEKIIWTEEFNDPRLLALRQGSGNIFITYAGGADNIYLNVADAADPGDYFIVPAPFEDDDRDPKGVTYGMAHFGGTPGMPHVVKSTSGMVRFTALEAGTGISGSFRFSALDENSAPHVVRGGFQDIPLR